MEESARPGFDDEDIENLRILISLAVEFHSFLQATHVWPPFPDDQFEDLIYRIDSTLMNVDSFRSLMHSYGILVGSRRSALDLRSISLDSLKASFSDAYERFIAETMFEDKCRLLLDLFKLQLIFAGAFYDCKQ